MITPNWNLFLWIFFIYWIASGIARILVGALKVEKSERYGIGDVLDGILLLILAIIVLIA